MTIFGIIGGCRGDEITRLTTEMVTDKDNELVILIPDSKSKVPILYQVDGEFAKIVREYMKMRPPHATTTRFFVQYRNGRCVNQVMGKNNIAKIPKEIAQFLGLPEYEKYSGHSFRRSSLTILANTGASLLTLKRHGNHKSAKVCEGYIQESLEHKRRVGSEISGAINLPSTSTTKATNNLISSAHQKKPLTLFDVGSSTSASFGSDTGDGSVTLTQTMKRVGVSVPEGKSNVIFHFSGNVTINMK